MIDKKNLKSAKLDEEQLENVAGGTYLESADDAKKFQKLGEKIYNIDILGTRRI